MERSSRSGRAGFTLIEVMIALTLAVALTALAWASLSPLRDQVVMDEATAMVADGIERARSMASSTNQVLEVRARIEATSLEIQARAIAPGASEDAAREDAARPWSVLVRLEGAFAREDPADEGHEPREPMRMDGEPELISIGVALPDGSMVAGVPLRLKDSDGRWSVVRVGTWTTRIEVEAPAVLEDEEMASEEARADGSGADGSGTERSQGEPADGPGRDGGS